MRRERADKHAEEEREAGCGWTDGRQWRAKGKKGKRRAAWAGGGGDKECVMQGRRRTEGGDETGRRMGANAAEYATERGQGQKNGGNGAVSHMFFVPLALIYGV